jgi:hypothetical protein
MGSLAKTQLKDTCAESALRKTVPWSLPQLLHVCTRIKLKLMKKQFLSLGLMLLSGVAMAQYPTNGLVAYFPLNGNGNDVGPNAIIPTYFEAESVENRSANQNYAASFTAGNAEYAAYDMAVNSMLELENNYSIGFWSKADANAQAGEVLLSLGGGIEFSYAAASPSGLGIKVSINQDGTVTESDVAAIANITTQWNHFMLLRGTSSYVLFVNGTSQGTITLLPGTIEYATDQLLIGRGQSGSNEFNGSMDDVFIYDRTLSSTERANVRNSGLCIAVSSTVTFSSSPSIICAGVPVDFTLNHPNNSTTFILETENGWTGSISGNTLTVTPPLEPINSWPLGAHVGFSVFGSNDCSVGPATPVISEVRVPVAPFVVIGNPSSCTGISNQYYVINPVSTPTWTVPSDWTQGALISTGNGAAFTTGLESGPVSFTVDNGCFSRTETLEVTVYASVPEAPSLVEGTLLPCKGETTLYTFDRGEGAASNTIQFPSNFSTGWTSQADTDTSIFITPMGSLNGPFNITAYSSNACGSSSNTLVPLTSSPNPLSGYAWIAPYNDVYLSGGNYTGIVTFQWLLEGEPIEGATEEEYTPLVSGNYSLQVEFVNFDCGTEVSSSVYVEVTITGVDENRAGRLNLYPNPATTSFTMDGLTAGSTITVMDAMGRNVMSTAVSASRMEVSLVGLSTGIYMVQVQEGNAIRTARLMVN